MFNLLPIIPLDGSKMLLSLLELKIPFKLSLKIMNIISIIFIFIFFLYNKINLNMLLLTTFLLFKTYIEIIEHKNIFNKFLLERYLYKLDYKKIKKVSSLNQIYKNRQNFINNNSEYKILRKKFDYN